MNQYVYVLMMVNVKEIVIINMNRFFNKNDGQLIIYFGKLWIVFDWPKHKGDIRGISINYTNDD